MTKYVCANCGADAVTESADGTTIPEEVNPIVPNVTHCSNASCKNSDPHVATADDFVPAEGAQS